MRRIVAMIIAATAIGTLVVTYAYTAPKPSEAKIAWELDFTFKPPRPIRVQLPGETKKRLFWYMMYTVTNRTDKDQIFVPDFDLYTDTGQLIQAGRKTPSAVFDAIKSLQNAPLMQNVPAMAGKILQGEDNAKDSVAIWHDFDPEAGSFDVFVGSLSGESVEVKLPYPVKVVKVDARGRKKTEVWQKKLLLTKTLQLTFKIPGEAAARTRTPVKLTKKTWVMR